MKIDKGYTLSQLIDLIANDKHIFLQEAWDLTVKYNDFLKQPLTKEMFVNEFKKPIGYDNWYYGNGRADGVACVKWQESEKKVIFEESIKSDYSITSCRCEETGILDVYFCNHLGEFMCRTIGELFEQAYSDVKLKNVEL